MNHAQSLRVLNFVFWTAVVVSMVHYTDNYVAYESFPQSDSLPNPSAITVLISWFVFTAAGLTGYALFRQQRYRPASLFLALYSVSGLVGIGHYTVGGMTDAVWWRQAHVIADILLGIAVFVFTVFTARRLDPPRAHQAGTA